MNDRIGSLWAGAELIDEDNCRREAIGCEKRYEELILSWSCACWCSRFEDMLDALLLQGEKPTGDDMTWLLASLLCLSFGQSSL